MQGLQQSLDAARLRFGRFLRNWRRSNDWSVTTAMEWAKACPQIIPWEFRVSGGQWGNLENGKVMQPQPSTFLQLGVLNECLARQERGVIHDQVLRERVMKARPVCHADGRPWGAEDWFACYIGKLEGPEDLWPRQEDIDAEEETRRLHVLFQSTLRARGLRPASAAIDVLRRAGDLPMEQVVAIENALIEGERLPASTVEVAREAVHDWVRAVAGDLELTAGKKGATKELVVGASG